MTADAAVTVTRGRGTHDYEQRCEAFRTTADERAVLGALTAVLVFGAMLTGPTVASADSADIQLGQADLNGLAYHAGSVDGVSGPQTEAAAAAAAAAESFPSDRCLSADGIIGSQTLGELETVVKAAQGKAGVSQDG